MGKKKKVRANQAKKNAEGRDIALALEIGVPKRDGDDLFGFMAGRLEIAGDIVSPIEDWSYWDPAKNLEK